MIRFLVFFAHLITGQIDPAPRVKGGTFGTHRPMSYAAFFWIIFIIGLIVVQLVAFPHGPSQY